MPRDTATTESQVIYPRTSTCVADENLIEAQLLKVVSSCSQCCWWKMMIRLNHPWRAQTLNGRHAQRSSSSQVSHLDSLLLLTSLNIFPPTPVPPPPSLSLQAEYMPFQRYSTRVNQSWRVCSSDETDSITIAYTIVYVSVSSEPVLDVRDKGESSCQRSKKKTRKETRDDKQ